MTFIDNTIIYNNHVILQKNNENENLYKYLWNSKKIYLKMPKINFDIYIHPSNFFYNSFTSMKLVKSISQVLFLHRILP